MGVETTFATDLLSNADIKEQALLLLGQLQRRLQKYASERVVRGWGLKIGFSGLGADDHQCRSSTVVNSGGCNDLVGQGWRGRLDVAYVCLDCRLYWLKNSGQLCLWRDGVMPHCDSSQTASTTVIHTA